MKVTFFPSDERGETYLPWLVSRHSFSFGKFYDPDRMGFGALRVLNDDIIAAGQGFGAHPHNDMEIITLVLQGALEHKDDTGAHATLPKDAIQTMTAGSGIEHSEFNPSKETPAHILQLWIETKKQGLNPRHAERNAKPSEWKEKFALLVGPKENKKTLSISQDAYISRSSISAKETLTYELHKKGNGVYLFVIDGTVRIGDETLEKRDAAGVTEAATIKVAAVTDADVVAIEVPLE
jgi:redox-sensitive bicupin YhaK (pirin superfamily)